MPAFRLQLVSWASQPSVVLERARCLARASIVPPSVPAARHAVFRGVPSCDGDPDVLSGFSHDRARKPPSKRNHVDPRLPDPGAFGAVDEPDTLSEEWADVGNVHDERHAHVGSVRQDGVESVDVRPHGPSTHLRRSIPGRRRGCVPPPRRLGCAFILQVASAARRHLRR